MPLKLLLTRNRQIHWRSFPAVVAAIVLLLLAGPLPATGQEPVSLSADSLVQFERVRIHLYSPRTLQLSGRIVSSENDTLRLESDAGRMKVAHDQIHRLQVTTDEGNPGEGFALGASIGGVIGGLGTFATYGPGVAAFRSITLGALVGGMIGLASSGPTWQDAELRP